MALCERITVKFIVLTLFPEMFEIVKTSVIKRAIENGLIELEVINIRDFSKNNYNQVDDTPYGGGAGMVLKPDVVADSIKFAKTKLKFLGIVPLKNYSSFCHSF